VTGSGCFAMTSNGLGSGNHPLEAISHGICEVVERDAERLWELRDAAAQERTRIDPHSVDEPDCRSVLDRFEQAGIAVALWEITSDIGLPAFLCLAGEREVDPLRAFGAAVGKGCHPDRAIALLRALTEAAQSRLTQIAGSRDDIDRATYAAAYESDVQARNRAWLLGSGGGRPFAAAPTHQADTLDDDVAWELERLRAAGIERVVVVDLSRPEMGVAVVRVVVPDLEGPTVIRDLAPGKRARMVLDGVP
jgi:ribosomal protein S12 methylthiotransferase accessory factor